MKVKKGPSGQLRLIAFTEGVVVLVGLGSGVERFSYRELGFNEELEEVDTGETLVLPVGVGGLEVGHTIEETQEAGSAVHCRVDSFVPQFAEETAVTKIDRLVDDTDVVTGVIEDVTVDVIHHFAFGSIGDVTEGAGGEIMAIFVAVVAQFGVRDTTLQGCTTGFVTVDRFVSVRIDEVAVGVLVEEHSVDDLGRYFAKAVG